MSLTIFRTETTEFTAPLALDGAPLDLGAVSALELEVKARPGDDDPALVHLDLSSGIVPLPPDINGLVVAAVSFTPARWEDVPAGVYYFDLKAIVDGQPKLVIKPMRLYLKDGVNQ